MCLILARGGSIRIPKKNIKPLCSRPLISYTIECAKKSRYINKIIVSTDSEEIAEISKKWGAEVPFLRPREISDYDSTELDAFKHALRWLSDNEAYEPDLIVKLFSTSPFRRTESVDAAIELLIQNPAADAVRSVRLCTEHPYKMWQIKENRLQSLIPLDQKPNQAHTLSYQVLPKVYVNNASFDITKPSNIWKKSSITGTDIIPFEMDYLESIDINLPIDFAIAEMIMRKEVAF